MSFPYFISPEQAMRERSELARKGASADTSLGAASYIAQAVAGLAKDAADPSRKKMPRPRRR